MSRRPPRGRDRGRRSGHRDDEDRFDDDGPADDDWEDEPPREPRRRGAPKSRDRGAGRKEKRSFFGLFGSQPPSRRPSRGQRFDWGDDDDGYEDSGQGGRYEADYEEERAPGRRRSRPSRERRLSLMELCTPVFGYAALLPQEESGPQPQYTKFRDEVLVALKRIEDEAPRHGIESEDAREAVYALSLFVDGQVAESAWAVKSEWMAEPLHIVKLQDAEGGINFFNHLDGLGDRQKAVREVFLVCLALGFRGKYAELDATQQAAQIGEIRQRVVRSIHSTPLEKLRELFPDAYRPADPIEDEVPPPPRWWAMASLGAVVLAVLVYVILFFAAGRSPRPADATVKPLLSKPQAVLGEPARGAKTDRPEVVA